MSKQRTPSDLFAGAIEQIARAFKEPRKQGTCEPSMQAIQAIRQKQEEHEECKRRISQKVANGSRISRNL
jgi:hypothetical protein